MCIIIWIYVHKFFGHCLIPEKNTLKFVKSKDTVLDQCYRVFQEKCLFKKLNYAQKIKELYEMLYICRKPVLVHLCFKYLKRLFQQIMP